MSRLILVLSTLALGMLAIAAPAPADTVAIVGTGRVGAALGAQFARHGHRVVYGSREPGDAKAQALAVRTGHGARVDTQEAAVANASIVVLAIPFGTLEATVKRLPLAGRIVIDSTNALRHGDSGYLEPAVDTSAGELVQQWAPQARVVKAFNTIGDRVLARPALAKGAVTVPIAGDDADAKRRVAQFVQSFGLRSADVGPLRHARVLEGMAILFRVPSIDERPEQAFEYYLRPVAQPADRRP